MKNEQLKKTFDYVGKILSSALLVLLVIVGLFLVYYLITARIMARNPNYEPKIRLYTIVSGSMEPNIRVYDVILDTTVTKPEQIKIGDVITFKSTSNISNGLIVTHRVVDIRNVNGKPEYVTKGDYNPTPDGDTAKFDNIIGKVRMRFPQLGRLQFFLAKKIGWLVVVVLPALGVIIYDIIKLIKLVKIKDEGSNINNNNKPGNNTIDKSVNDVINSDYLDRLKALKEFENQEGQ